MQSIAQPSASAMAAACRMNRRYEANQSVQLGSPGTSQSKKPMWARHVPSPQFTTGLSTTFSPSPCARRIAPTISSSVTVGSSSNGMSVENGVACTAA